MSSATPKTTSENVPTWSYKGIRRRMRTIEGQFGMMGGAILGAVAMAIAALCLRTILFDPYIRQRNPEPTPAFVKTMQEIADGARSAESIDEFSSEQVAVAYGILIDHRIQDSKKVVTRRITHFQSPVVVDRLKITAATGSDVQRLAAISVIAEFSAPVPPDAVTILNYIRERGRRTKNNELFQAVEAVFSQPGFRQEGAEDE